MEKLPPNPFRECSLSELHDAAEELAGTLLGRSELATQAAHLLMVLGRRIAPQPHMPQQPEHAIANGAAGFPEAFIRWAEQEQQTVRFLALQRAAEYRLSARARLWRPVEPNGSQSDEAMRRVMEELAAVGVGAKR